MCRSSSSQKAGVDDRHRLHLAALGEDRQPLLGVVEVPELHALEGALADAHLQEQAQGEVVAPLGVGEDGPLLIGREHRPLDASFLRRADRPRRVAVQAPGEDRPLEETL